MLGLDLVRLFVRCEIGLNQMMGIQDGHPSSKSKLKIVKGKRQEK